MERQPRDASMERQPRDACPPPSAGERPLWQPSQPKRQLPLPLPRAASRPSRPTETADGNAKGASLPKGRGRGRRDRGRGRTLRPRGSAGRDRGWTPEPQSKAASSLGAASSQPQSKAASSLGAASSQASSAARGGDIEAAIRRVLSAERVGAVPKTCGGDIIKRGGPYSRPKPSRAESRTTPVSAYADSESDIVDTPRGDPPVDTADTADAVPNASGAGGSAGSDGRGLRRIGDLPRSL